MKFFLSAVALLVLAGNLVSCQTSASDNRRITLSFIEDVDLTRDEILEYLTDQMENTIGNVEAISVDGQTVTLTFTDIVNEIGEEAFYDFPLTSVTIPNSVTMIGDKAFADCLSLTFISLPNSVTKIGDEAFRNCDLTSITIPNSVTEIGNYAFYSCSSLTSVTIPNSVTQIGDAAFVGCKSLTSVTMPNSVTMIGERAFEDCSSLASVTIPNSVTMIGSEAFAGCPLEYVTVPRNAEIAEDSFEETTRIIYQ